MKRRRRTKAVCSKKKACLAGGCIAIAMCERSLAMRLRRRSLWQQPPPLPRSCRLLGAAYRMRATVTKPPASLAGNGGSASLPRRRHRHLQRLEHYGVPPGAHANPLAVHAQRLFHPPHVAAGAGDGGAQGRRVGLATRT